MSAVSFQTLPTTAQAILAGCRFEQKFSSLTTVGKVTRVALIAAIIIGLAKVAFALFSAIWLAGAALVAIGICLALTTAALLLAQEILSRSVSRVAS